MSSDSTPQDEETATIEAREAFEREVGVTGIDIVKTQAGPVTFLKFVVGREAPLYLHALYAAQNSLSPNNPFDGAMGLKLRKSESFPGSPRGKRAAYPPDSLDS